MLAASEWLESAKAGGAWVWENGLRVAAAGGPLRNLLSQLTVDDWLIDAAKGLSKRGQGPPRGPTNYKNYST